MGSPSQPPDRRTLRCCTSPAEPPAGPRVRSTSTRQWSLITPPPGSPSTCARGVFWCTADPGWVTGTSYGIIGPLTCGATVVTDAADFDAKRWYRILEEQKVAVFYTAPTALRMLMREGADLAREHDLSALKHVVSVGEPLNPEAAFWGLEAFNLPVHDTWWQTETGAIMISNYPGMPIRPGSMDGRCPASRSRCWKEARTGEPTSSKAKSGSWPSPG